MFAVNDIIMYGNAGVYKIIDIRPEKFSGNEVLYYVLAHIHNENMVVYCPVDNEKIPLRPLISVEEIDALIDDIPNIRGHWIENDQKRNEQFTKTLKTGLHHELLQLIIAVYDKRIEKEQAGKKLHLADERAMREAEKVLNEELAYVLQIDSAQVPEYIQNRLKAK